MRQGNGAELLGSNDPRSGTIGVIDVAPTDDREGVVAAILTQDKLGRKQIVVNLPADNKAFQRPIDFDGLKNMRRKLQAQLIIVAPGGSAPAEFARQRRFPVYSSKENFKQSLGTGPQQTEQPRGRWLFGTSKPKLQPVDASSANGNGKQSAPPPVVPVPLPVDAGMQSPPAPDPTPENEPAAPEAPPSFPADEQDEDEATDLPAPIMFPGAASPSNSHNQTTEPDPDGQASAPEDDAHENGHDAGPVPLLLPVVPPSPAPTVQPHTPSINQPSKRNSGKMLALGGAGAAGAAGGAMVARASAGGPPPPVGPRAGGPPPSRPPGSRRRLWLLALVALLIASLLIFGGIALAAPGVFGSFGTAVKSAVSGSPDATVTITPKSQKLSNNFTILAVTGKPNGNQRQVQARVLTTTTAPSKTTAKATGHTQTPATNATGTLTFFNASTSVQVVLAGTVFNVNGVQIENTGKAVIPAAHLPTVGQATVSARAITSGSRGNIPAYSLNGVACCGGPISVSNTSAFHGGQDPQNFTFIQQSDVNNAAAPLASQLKTQAMSTVAGQKHAGEQFVKEPGCSTKVVANPPVGAHANSTTVTVTATCSGEVYDASGAQAMAANLLKEKAATNPGSHYVLVGDVQTTPPQVAAVNSQTNTVELLVQAAGVWEYQFSDADKQNLAKAIAGKTKEAAQALLLQQPGVAQVDSISIANGGTTLPTDATQIEIVIQNVPGQPGLTPTAAPPGSPTPGSGTPVTGNG